MRLNSGARAMELLDFLNELADVAGDAILPHFRTRLDADNGLQNKKQGDGFDPVTVADRASERAMRALISERFPDHGVLGEEFENTQLDADEIWILDPIDGTRAFISGLPVWGVLIGHKKSGRAHVGMMAQPYTGERFYGDGAAAWMTRAGQVADKSGPISLKTRPCASLAQATLFTTAPELFSKPAAQKYQAIEDQVRLHRYGVDCYAFAMLAAGHVDVVIEADLKPFDIAALIPIIEGAGGRVTTWDGGNAVDGGSIIACGDPALHEDLLKILR